MSKKASIIRLFCMALAFAALLISSLSYAFEEFGVLELFVGVPLYFGMSCLVADLVWICSKMYKYLHRFLNSDDSDDFDTDSYDVYIPGMSNADDSDASGTLAGAGAAVSIIIYCLPLLFVYGVFMAAASFPIDELTFTNIALALLLLLVLPLALLVPMVLSDICHIKGILFKDMLRTWTDNRKKHKENESGVTEVQVAKAESAETETMVTDEGQEPQTTNNT